ncbi:MAG: prolyl oligopeptidase family serine peptidase [Tepidisphaera sp.]|nr:prolyl oligopeptidase family serine peptidase [Tepidisphaera sp.]
MNHARLLSSSLLVCSSMLATVALAGGPPETPKHPVTDELHGVKIVDDYRWLENWDDPAVKAWSDAQNQYARSVLDAMPNVEEIRKDVSKILSASSVSYGSLSPREHEVFALKRQPPKQQPFIVAMPDAAHPDQERVVVDPTVIDPTGGTSIDWYEASPDGSMVAVSLSKGGSESGDVHIFDTKTGKQVHEVITRVNGGTAGGSLAWAPDSKSFFYTRYPRQGERPEADMDFYMQVYHHTLGDDPSKDHYELGKDFPKIAEIMLDCAPSGAVLASMQKGDGGEFQHYLRTLDGQWQQLDKYEDRIVQAVLHGEGKNVGVYMVSRDHALRGKLLRLDCPVAAGPAPALSKAVTLIPEGEDTLVSAFAEDTGNLAITQHAIIAEYQTGGPSEFRVFDLEGKSKGTPKQLPIGSVGGVAVMNAAKDQAIFSNVSYVQPQAWYTLDAADLAVAKTKLAQTSPVDFSDIEVTREFATSKDGTKIPVNILRKKGVKPNGKNPCLVTAYGGYGVNITPAFRPQNRVLLDQGFVWAEANIRGGGEYGEAWHQAGNLTRKQNVFDDMIAAVEFMQQKGYTSPAHTAIIGGSNGGLLMGAVLTQRPDLLKAVVSSVGIYDMLRVELSPNGAFNVTEFGTVKDEAQFKALYAYSPYHHVKEGVKYPPVLFLTGANDPRVDPMQSRKMTARLQAVGSTVLLRTSANSGHGIGTALSERIEQTVDIDAFLFHELGVNYAYSK